MGRKRKKLPVYKNETVTVTIEDLTSDGNGVGKVNGYPLFIPEALPGEKIDCLVVKVNKNFGYGKLTKIHRRSKNRVTPICPVYYKCGGCQLQHMDYSMQLDMKTNQVKQAFARIANMENVKIHPTLGMEDPWRYRNNVQIPVGEKNGQLITGFYQQRSHHIIDDMQTCYIQEESNDAILHEVREVCNRFGIKAYDEKNHKGLLRHIIVRTGYFTKEAMVVLVTNGSDLPKEKKLIQEIQQIDPNIKSVIQNINTKRTNVIMGPKERVLWGQSHIYDTIGDLKFAISARSFYQVNPLQTKVLYDQVLKYAKLTGDETVIDAYCGIGTISLFLAQKAKKVYGVEIVAEAIEDANYNARLNGLNDVAEFVTGEAEKVIYDWLEQKIKPDLIVVDPPRKGCDLSFLQAVINLQPKQMIYVSCNPATLARDAKILHEGGFQVKEVQPVDMFSQTRHVECVALMSRVDE